MRIAIAAVSVVVWCGLTLADEMPENLAPRTRVSASSQFSHAYRPEMAVSGVVPSQFQEDGDWAVCSTHDGQFTLQWDEPVEATQITYYARVTSPLLECSKDYEVYLNDDREPVVSVYPSSCTSPLGPSLRQTP